MTAADWSTSSGGDRVRWRWDVALSFAGAQRDYVKQVAQALQARGLRCFYDADEEIGLWGRYLAEELPTIYGEQAAAVVVFVSAEYAARDWTRSSGGPRWPGPCRSGGNTCCQPDSMTRASRSGAGHGRGRPARPDPGPVRRADCRQAGGPWHHRSGPGGQLGPRFQDGAVGGGGARGSRLTCGG